MEQTVNQKDGIEKAIKLAIKEKNFKLTEPLEDVLIRYQFAHDKRLVFLKTQSKLYKLRFDVTEALVREFNISIKQAYLDYANMLKILDNCPPLQKREIAFEMQIEQIDEDMMLAREEKDLRALAALHRVKADLQKSYPQAMEVDWASISFPVIRALFDPKLINSKVIETPEELAVLNAKLKEKYSSKSASDFINSIAKDVSFTDNL